MIELTKIFFGKKIALISFNLKDRYFSDAFLLFFCAGYQELGWTIEQLIEYRVSNDPEWKNPFPNGWTFCRSESSELKSFFTNAVSEKVENAKKEFKDDLQAIRKENGF